MGRLSTVGVHPRGNCSNREMNVPFKRPVCGTRKALIRIQDALGFAKQVADCDTLAAHDV